MTSVNPSLSEVAEGGAEGLVAEGLTNHEIADRLIISPRTAETHVGNILAKLDHHSRAAVAAWQASHDADPRRTSASGSRRR